MSGILFKNTFPEGWQAVDQADARAVVRFAVDRFQAGLALASSFGLEDVALIHMLVEMDPHPHIFALDTGRLPEETYECAERVRQRYGVAIEWFFPQAPAVEELERTQGLFSFRASVANRKTCCGIRKVEPLKRALAGRAAWITGQRRAQSITRAGLAVLESDKAHNGIWKFNPLADWTLDEVWAYVRKYDIPYNALHDQGYPSIGCAPCTRAVQPGEDERAGRWWWEEPEHKECGLHLSQNDNRARSNHGPR